jgi:LAO/AO transport system kinase
MTDMFVLMQLPNAGDDLQAIKKGVMELADLVLINKADLDADAAMRAQVQITSAMRLFGLVAHALAHDGRAGAAHWQPQVLQLSALHGTGVPEFWTAVMQFQAMQRADGKLESRRAQQALAWMWERIDAELKSRFKRHPVVQGALPALQDEVRSGRLAASTAARRLLSLLEP